MADVQPLRALHYDQERRRAAPGPRRAALRRDRPRPARGARRPLAAQRRPRRPAGRATTPTREAARLLRRWQRRGRGRPRREPALWALHPGLHRARRRAATRRGFFARVRVEDYGPGQHPPARAHAPRPEGGPAHLTRATQANLCPIFSLFSDPAGAAWARARAVHPRASRGARRPTTTAPPTASGGSPTRRRSPPSRTALGDAELLIADGHHRYETARVYADEIGGEGDAPLRADVPRRAAGPGPDGLPHPPAGHATPRPRRQEALAAALREHFDITPLDAAAELPPARRATARSSSATSTPTSSSPSA